MRRFALVALLLVGVVGCGFMFGGPEQLIDQDGNLVFNPDGTPAMVYKEGAVQKLTKAIAPVAKFFPYGVAGSTLLGIIGTIGAGVQTIRHKRRIDPDDVRKLVDDLGSRLDDIKSDEDLGDLVANWNPDSDLAKKVKRAFEKDRSKNSSAA